MTEAGNILYPDPEELKEFLETKYLQFNNASFIAPDPVSIPHRFTLRQDIEISGFLVAAIAWGRRDLILRSASRLMDIMGNAPFDFVMSADDIQRERLESFVYRTFNGSDAKVFVKGLRHIYSLYSSPEDLFAGVSVRDGLSRFRREFFHAEPYGHAHKHFANVETGSAGKRLNMYLRWMVRKDRGGVDFGLWKNLTPAQLYIPLDLHSGNSARKLGLLTRKQSDWKAVEELTENLRQFDPSDPVKYDYALFGLGVNEKF